jgi:hypothetical protein
MGTVHGLVSIAVAGEDGDIVVCDSQVVRGEHGGTTDIKQVKKPEKRVWFQVGDNVSCGSISWEMR